METLQKILVIEDEPSLAKLITRVLQEEGYSVGVAKDGEQGLIAALASQPSIAIIDVGLPTIDGFAVCKELRSRGVDIPVIMLTARDSIPDRVTGLDAGADDYIVKPFAFDELLARIRAHLRRYEPLHEVLHIDDLSLDPAAHRVERGGIEIELTAQEFGLLEVLLRHEGQVLTRQQLLDHVWGYLVDPNSNVVDLYIHYLRRKIDHGTAKKLVHTVRAVGYVVRT